MRRHLLIAALAPLAACAPEPPVDVIGLAASPTGEPAAVDLVQGFMPRAYAPPGKALVVLYRNSGWEGRLDTYRVAIAGQNAAHMDNGTKAMIVVPPGVVSMRAFAMPKLTNLLVGPALQDTPRLDFVVEPDLAYFVEVSSAANAGPQLRHVDAARALSDAPRLRTIREP